MTHTAQNGTKRNSPTKESGKLVKKEQALKLEAMKYSRQRYTNKTTTPPKRSQLSVITSRHNAGRQSRGNKIPASLSITQPIMVETLDILCLEASGRDYQSHSSTSLTKKLWIYITTNIPCPTKSTNPFTPKQYKKLKIWSIIIK